MHPLSLVIITYNAAEHVSKCIESAKNLVDEIIVVDSGSTDGTVDLATSLGARVIYQSWKGFGPQKHYAVSYAKHDWVLCLDADEALTTTLADAIKKALISPHYQAYRFARCNRFLGRYLRYGEGYPDMSLRLFNRHHAQWTDDLVHEKVSTASSIGRLEGDLLHHSAETLSQYLIKQNHYTDLQAQSLWAQKRRVGLFTLFFSPFLRFIKFYFFKQGFRDGVPGFIHTVLGCINSFIKYSKLIELHRKNENK